MSYSKGCHTNDVYNDCYTYWGGIKRDGILSEERIELTNLLQTHIRITILAKEVHMGGLTYWGNTGFVCLLQKEY